MSSMVAGLAIWGVAISALVSWLAFCFGSIIIGASLLIFAPYILLAPMIISTPGTTLLIYGMDKVVNRERNSILNRT